MDRYFNQGFHGLEAQALSTKSQWPNTDMKRVKRTKAIKNDGASRKLNIS
jgi:hypothetical protein